MEGFEISTFGGRIQRRLHAVIAGNEGGVYATHAHRSFIGGLWIACQALVPVLQPVINARSLREEVPQAGVLAWPLGRDRKSTRLNSSHLVISYAVFCLKKKKQKQ